MEHGERVTPAEIARWFTPASPLPGGVMLAEGVRLAVAPERPESAEVTEYTVRLYRGELDIGGVDYLTCHACRQARVGEIGLIESEQRHGLGTRVLEHLRTELPGYRWYLTPVMARSTSFWQRLRVAYPDEYYDCTTGGVERGQVCLHIGSVS